MRLQILAILCGFIIALAAGHVLIPLLKRLKAGQHIRDDGPQSHLSKSGTPTMGGIMILIGTIASSLIFARGNLEMLLAAIGVYLAYSIIGLVDDLIIVRRQRSMGLRGWQKILAQSIFGVLLAVYAYFHPEVGSTVIVPFLNIEWNMGIWFIPFTVFVIVAMVNAVNLTDGLDGLASSVTMLNSFTYVFIFTGLAAVSVAQDMQNMAVFAGALAGACIGFLRFNAYPAKVFMGDTGSLGLGAALTVMAVFSRMQLLLPIIGIMFVASAVSVVIQVGHYKRTKKRVFRMAPLHHHFELKGVSEPKIVSSYMIITTVLCLVALLSLS